MEACPVDEEAGLEGGNDYADIDNCNFRFSYMPTVLFQIMLIKRNRFLIWSYTIIFKEQFKFK